jgi:hypothetical protein
MQETLDKFLHKELLEKLTDLGLDPYPEFILSRDGQVYHLEDLYKVNALPGKIDDNSKVVKC